ncbi:MAG: S8 family serine peptidase [Pseudomonadota bacterium]
MVTWMQEETEGYAPRDALTYQRLLSQTVPEDKSSPPGAAPVVDLTWWSVMVELDGVSIDDFASAVRADFPDDMIVPAAYDAADRAAAKARQFVSLFARQSVLSALNNTQNNYGVLNVHLGMATPDEWLDPGATPPARADIPVADGTVVVGVIDDGLGIAHELFRTGPVSSRIACCSILAAPPLPGTNMATQGRLLMQAEIDQLLADCTFSGLLDEDLFYERTGQVAMNTNRFDPVAMRRSHGTHIMGIAAGFDPDVAEAKRPIVCAALPSPVVEDTSGISLMPALCLALQILGKEAERFKINGTPAPFVMNFSFGNFSGPHDGTSEVSRLLEDFLCANPDQKRWMTLPAGNGNLSQCHATLQFEEAAADGRRDDAVLDLRVLPDDMTASYVELWLPYSASTPPPDYVSVTVTAPFEDSGGTIEAREGQVHNMLDDHGQIIGTLIYTFEPAPTARGLITLSIEPTASHKAGKPLAPSGLWKIEVRPVDIGADEVVECWVRRDETLPGYRPGGRQAFFDNPGYQKFGPIGEPRTVDPANDPCPVRRSGTYSGFADGPSPLVVAAYTEDQKMISLYSATGPVTHTPMTPTPMRDGPDVAAKGDQSLVLAGVMSAGSRSGSYVRLNGTSVSCPRVARLAADQIAGWSGSGRDWLSHAITEAPFALDSNTPVTRKGLGGIDVDVDWTKPSP